MSIALRDVLPGAPAGGQHWSRLQLRLIGSSDDQQPSSLMLCIKLSLQTYSLAENPARGALVFKVTAFDPDIGDTLTYAIITGNVRDAFAIGRATGDVTVNAPSEVDYESRTSYALEVAITDSTGLSTRAIVTVNIINLVGAHCRLQFFSRPPTPCRARSCGLDLPHI